MANAFDPYREALVVETSTVWPDEFDDWEPADRARLSDKLHAEPQKAADMDYVRMHTGFCRQITVTPEDVARLSG
jgi:hypothetical protein